MSIITVLVCLPWRDKATFFTNEDFPQRRGDIRMVFTWLVKLSFSRYISLLRLVKSSALTVLPNKKGLCIVKYKYLFLAY